MQCPPFTAPAQPPMAESTEGVGEQEERLHLLDWVTWSHLVLHKVALATMSP